MKKHLFIFLIPLTLISLGYSQKVEITETELGLDITIGGQAFARYFQPSEHIPRPYFAKVNSPVGIQVSRAYPPVEGKDSMDHPRYHPGVMLTYAGINGNDYWRLKKGVDFDRYIGAFEEGEGVGAFTVSNHYTDTLEPGGNEVAEEIVRYEIVVRDGYYLLLVKAELRSDDHDLIIGDDQEYGFAFRVRTEIEERHGGRLMNSEYRETADKVYGRAAQWCDYSGKIDGVEVGMLVMSDPMNFRPSWHHARDSGLVAANPFGRKKVAGGAESEVLVKRGEALKLGFALAVYSEVEGQEVDRDAVFNDYLQLLRGEN